MGQPSTEASNAIIYLTYGAFLYILTATPNLLQKDMRPANLFSSLLGTGMAWKLSRHQSKSDFLAGNRTQSGINF